MAPTQPPQSERQERSFSPQNSVEERREVSEIKPRAQRPTVQQSGNKIVFFLAIAGLSAFSGLLVLIIAFLLFSKEGSPPPATASTAANQAEEGGSLKERWMKSDCYPATQREMLWNTYSSQYKESMLNQIIQGMLDQCALQKANEQKAEELGLYDMNLQELKDFYINKAPGKNRDKETYLSIIEQSEVQYQEVLKEQEGSASYKMLESTYAKTLEDMLIQYILMNY